jgi:thiol-disulfide isomerase/thioredoxin/sugar lactone lactonase YvrE
MSLTPAPEFPSDLEWVNTSRPLSLRALRGKVVLLDFWTYGCINCLHILPDLHRLEAAYPRELVVIGVHSAKYDNEGTLANIRQAVQRYGITHPVVNDRAFRMWKSYRVPGWPTVMVLDPEGNILQGFVGENHYERLDRLIASTVALHRHKGTLRDKQPFVAAIYPTPQTTPLRYPGKILADAVSSRLFIADTNHHRLVMSDLHGTVQAVIGTGHAGADDGSFATASFRQPQGIALLGSMLYVADTGNHLLRRVDLQRRVVETVLGSGEKARTFNVPGTGRRVALNSPWALYGQGAYVYIAMAGMHQLWSLELATGYAEPFAGSSREELVDELHLDAAFGQPSGLTGDGRVLYVADSEVNAIRRVEIDPDGKTSTLAGGGLFTFGDRDAVGAEARLQHPLGVTYADGVVYMADTYNHKIKRLDAQSGQVRTLAGTGKPGLKDGAAEQAQFYEPGGLSSAHGRLYVADTNNHRIRVVDVEARMVSTLLLRGLTPPTPQTTVTHETAEDAPVRLADHTLAAASQVPLHIVLQATGEWKVNEQAPATLTITTEGDAVQVPLEYAQRTLQPMTPQVSIPLTVAQAGTRAVLRVDLAFVMCQVGQQTICLPRQLAWEIPVQSRVEAAQSELVLAYRLLPF